MGIGDWGLGQSPIPNPQSPIPNPLISFDYINHHYLIILLKKLEINKLFCIILTNKKCNKWK